ncbi:TRAP transporter permease [Pseudomonas tumuqii]|uniref:TRAP transporter permease n=1 Tax=Pseudomonas tumuqii TaxID=2715755 RepID=UPI001552B6D1|nr:TRAP transporter fused permease subunit [Pseudomonas tumuqii]
MSAIGLKLQEHVGWRPRFQNVLSVLACLFSVYMVYATVFGPYRTTLVHLAIFLTASFVLYFLKDEGTDRQISWSKRIVNYVCVIGTLLSVTHLFLNLDRIITSWGASFLTSTDLVMAGILSLVVLEAARRESVAFFVLSVVGILYILFGGSMPGILGHAGMELEQFLYLTAYTAEGIYGFGLEVAASYIFMFLLLSASMTQTQTGRFIMDICNAFFGRRTGGPAKSAVVSSALLGTMVGSSIGNVATTGTFTIPLMKQAGIPAHKAAAIETVASEGSQFLPPIMGAGAFIMAAMTGIPYATIALAALIPALLYFVAIFAVVHFESVRLKLGGLSKEQIPDARQVFADGWHLLIPPILLFYLLMGQGMSPAYAGVITVIASIIVAMLRKSTRLSLGQVVKVFDDGARSAASVVALIVAIGFIQQALVTTGLGPRLSELILMGTHGSLILTLILSVITATLLGMGMPTPIAYVLLALFVAPALEAVGVSTLAAHLFLFYFAIKSGSTPPVAVVAIVAASIAEASWWKSSVTAFVYSLPSFIIAFMFVYCPELLMQGEWPDIALAVVTATIGTVAFAGALQGWFGWTLSIPERLIISVGAICLVSSEITLTVIGLTLVAAALAVARLRYGKLSVV